MCRVEAAAVVRETAGTQPTEDCERLMKGHALRNRRKVQMNTLTKCALVLVGWRSWDRCRRREGLGAGAGARFTRYRSECREQGVRWPCLHHPHRGKQRPLISAGSPARGR